MYPVLLGPLSKIKTLSDRLLFAHKLDHLDAKISTRAPASTALSNAVWTGPRAANLNAYLSNCATQTSANALNGDVNTVASNIDAPLSSCLTSVGDKIQAGVIDTFTTQSVSGSSTGIQEYYTDIAITAVSAVDQCVVILNGSAWVYGSGQYPQDPFIWGEMMGYLLDTNTLRISAISNQGLVRLKGGWFVIEWD